MIFEERFNIDFAVAGFRKNTKKVFVTIATTIIIYCNAPNADIEWGVVANEDESLRYQNTKYPL